VALFDQKKLMIRAAANEGQPKSLNRFVPYGPVEVAADAAACARAGAAWVHFHSRLDDGRQALEDDFSGANIYRRAIELTARETDVLLEPTNIPQGDFSDPADMAYLWALVDRPPAAGKLEVISLDAIRLRREKTGWDTASNRLIGLRGYDPAPDIAFEPPPVIAEVYRRGLVPIYGVADLAEIRLLAALARGGFLRPPVLLQINFYAQLMLSPYPSTTALDAFLHEWGKGIDCEIAVFVQGLSDRAEYERFLDACLDRGLHPRVGLGDAAEIYHDVPNAALVEQLAEKAAKRGLSPVTPAELRSRIGLAAT
jgi:uncharacterized protein (DUF849 family)